MEILEDTLVLNVSVSDSQKAKRQIVFGGKLNRNILSVEQMPQQVVQGLTVTRTVTSGEEL